MITRWRTVSTLNAVMITRRWQYYLSAAMITRWHYCISGVDIEYLYRRVATTHDLNAILYPPSSENTVRCIAVLAISRLSVHYTGDFNNFMHLYRRRLHFFKHTIKINLHSYPHPTETNVIFA